MIFYGSIVPEINYSSSSTSLCLKIGGGGGLTQFYFCRNRKFGFKKK